MSSAFDPLQLEIKKFIFHVVHHGEEMPILMDETPIDGFEIFFKKRIFEVLDGSKFDFLESSHFLDALRSIEEDEALFVPISQALAIEFHTHRDNRIKPGVMILTKVVFQGESKYILIKYDHEEVITYSKNGSKALLQEIKNTFSKSKESLQKSVIVNLDAADICALVRDKSDYSNITRFFKGFLGVTRRYDAEALTEKVREAFLNAVRKNSESLPNEYTSNAASTFYETVQSLNTFIPDEFAKQIFGIHYFPKLEKDFERELKSKDVYGEAFTFDKNIKKPRKRKLKTVEGVLIQFPESATDTIDIKNVGNKTIVTITTKKLHEETLGT